MHRLTPHPATPSRTVTGVQLRTHWLDNDELLLRWRVDGARHVVLPPHAGRGRAGDLWKTTCFEMFVDLGQGRYREFNFSPSGRWAAWNFTSYRVNAGDAEVADAPLIDVDRGTDILVAAVRIPGLALAGGIGGAFCAVIEEQGGQVSFWASGHHKDRPDFHDVATFNPTFSAVEQT